MSNHYPTVNRVAFKEGVRLTDACLDSPMVGVLRVAMRTAPPLGEACLVVTSANDSTHGGHSLHYVGRAFDIRYTGQRIGGVVNPTTWAPEQNQQEYQGAVAKVWAGRMRQQLGKRFDVVVEGNHIHVEWDERNGC